MRRGHSYYQYDRHKDRDKRFVGWSAVTWLGSYIGGLTTTTAATAATATTAATVATTSLTTAGVVAGAAVTGAAVVGGAAAIGSMTNKDSATPTIQALPGSPNERAAEIRAKADIDNKRRGAARNKSTYTSPLGLSDEDKSGIATKRLLGE